MSQLDLHRQPTVNQLLTLSHLPTMSQLLTLNRLLMVNHLLMVNRLLMANHLLTVNRRPRVSLGTSRIKSEVQRSEDANNSRTHGLKR